jgi:predicted transposase/invertase (TIGR01784 family)
MKKQYRMLFLTATLILTFSYSLHAIESPLEPPSKRIKTATSSEPQWTIHNPLAPLGEQAHNLANDNTQIYSIPTYDATFKYMLSDPKICLSFLKTFTLKSNIEYIERLDEHLRPVQGYQDAQSLINDQKSKDLMRRITNLTDKETEIDVVYIGSQKKQTSVANGGWFLSELSKIYGDVLNSFPTPERNSAVDVLCRLNDGSYALVEVQVVEQDYWDQRALAYASSVYSRQMKKSDKWHQVQEVICINILGGGLKSVAWDSARTFKHYKFKDQTNAPLDGGIEILQYPLYHSATLIQASREATNDDQRLALEEWIDFLEHASRKKTVDVLQVKTEGLKEAYEKIKSDTLPQLVKEANERQDEEIFKASARVIAQKEQKAREEGEQIGIAKGEQKLLEEKKNMARIMLKEGIDIQTIFRVTGFKVTDFSEEEIKPLDS